MLSYPAILQAILPVFLIMTVGFTIRRVRLVSSKGDEGLMKLAVFVFLPSLILDNILGNSLLESKRVVFGAMTIGCGWVLLGFAFSYLIAPVFGLTKGSIRRTFGVSTGIQNYGFLAIPILATLFPGKETLGVLFMHSLGVELAMWTVGIMVLTGVTQAQWKLLLNGPMVAIVLGLALNYSGAHNHVPGVARTVFAALGQCAIPVCLLLVGATISDLMASSKSLFTGKMTMAGSCLVRLILLPIPLLLAVATLKLAPELKQVLVVQAAMPAAVFPIVLARHYGGHATTAIQVVIATTCASILTMPLVISIGLRWIEAGGLGR